MPEYFFVYDQLYFICLCHKKIWCSFDIYAFLSNYFHWSNPVFQVSSQQLLYIFFCSPLWKRETDEWKNRTLFCGVIVNYSDTFAALSFWKSGWWYLNKNLGFYGTWKEWAGQRICAVLNLRALPRPVSGAKLQNNKKINVLLLRRRKILSRSECAL